MKSSMELCLDTLRGIYGDTDRVLELSLLDEFDLTVVLVTRILGIGVNMGLSQMVEDEIEGDPGYRSSIQAFQRIGVAEVASMIAELQSLDDDIDESITHAKAAIDDRFYELEPICFDRLASFIEAQHGQKANRK